MEIVVISAVAAAKNLFFKRARPYELRPPRLPNSVIGGGETFAVAFSRRRPRAHRYAAD
jgi:hypothetical protein